MMSQEYGSATLFESNQFRPIQEFTETGNAEMLCDFCDAPPDQDSFFDISQPLGLGNVALKPALGMLLPGYLLAITREHVTSFAQLDKVQLQEVDSSLVQLNSQLGGLFGEYFRFEHGSDVGAQCSATAGACIEHAHQHLVPAPEAAQYMLHQKHPDQANVRWQQIDAFEDLAELKGRPYLYLGYGNTHYIALDPGVRSQWMRRQVAHVYDLPIWDWALYNGARELETTLRQLGCVLPECTEWDGDVVTYKAT